MAFRMPSVSAPPLLTHSTALVQNVPCADGGGHEVGGVEADPGGTVRDLGSDLELVGALVPRGRGRGVGRDGAAGLDPSLDALRRGEELGDGTDFGPIGEHHQRVGRALGIGLGRVDGREREDADVLADHVLRRLRRWRADPGRSPGRTRSGSSASSTSGSPGRRSNIGSIGVFWSVLMIACGPPKT